MENFTSCHKNEFKDFVSTMSGDPKDAGNDVQQKCYTCERKRKARAQKLDALLEALDEYVRKQLEVDNNLIF